jgi:proline dehydrogenase
MRLKPRHMCLKPHLMRLKPRVFDQKTRLQIEDSLLQIEVTRLQVEESGLQIAETAPRVDDVSCESGTSEVPVASVHLARAMLSRTLIIKTSGWKPVEKLVRKSFLFRPLVKRFIAGDDLETAMAAAQALLDRGFGVSLDNLGENTKTDAEALQAKSTYIQMLDRIGAQQAAGSGQQTAAEKCNISIKLTQCGLDLGVDYAERNFRDVLEVAKQYGNFVRVDMEASAYTERTMEIMKRVIPDFSNTGTVLQSYLHRTDDDLETLIALKSRVRLVKGAYLEPASVAIQEKAKVDEAYVRQAKRLLDAGVYPAIATHDEKIVNELNAYIAEKAIDKTGFEYQMLYGIRRDLQDRLKGEGYNVRVYVPFGDAWYPYFTRRLAERPANAFFILKSLFKG